MASQQNPNRARAKRQTLTIDQILTWADAHRLRTGLWPRERSGPVPEAPGLTWESVSEALCKGFRGLPGGSSLAKLLLQMRGARKHERCVPLTEEKILAWADAHFQRENRWPAQSSGAIADAPGETWAGVDTALFKGGRGLSGGSSLAKLLARAGRKRNRSELPPLTVEQILEWAWAHCKRAHHYPYSNSGAIPEAPEETWHGIDAALRGGHRGLPGGRSLRRFLMREGFVYFQKMYVPIWAQWAPPRDEQVTKNSLLDCKSVQ